MIVSCEYKVSHSCLFLIKCGFSTESARIFLGKSVGPLVSGTAVEVEGSEVVI